MYCWPDRETCSVHADPSQYRSSNLLEGSAYQPAGTEGDAVVEPAEPAPDWPPQLDPAEPEAPDVSLLPHDELAVSLGRVEDWAPSLPDEPQDDVDVGVVEAGSDEPPPQPAGSAGVDDPADHADGLDEEAPPPDSLDEALVAPVAGEPEPSRLRYATTSLPAETMLTTDQPSADRSPSFAVRDSASYDDTLTESNSCMA
ncbi:hypothetical protein BH24ACT6_BH24ACT6_15930 [soil metagenome]